MKLEKIVEPEYRIKGISAMKGLVFTDFLEGEFLNDALQSTAKYKAHLVSAPEVVAFVAASHDFGSYLTRTAAIIYKSAGKWYCAFDDSLCVSDNVLLQNALEHPDMADNYPVPMEKLRTVLKRAERDNRICFAPKSSPDDHYYIRLGRKGTNFVANDFVKALLGTLAQTYADTLWGDCEDDSDCNSRITVSFPQIYSIQFHWEDKQNPYKDIRQGRKALVTTVDIGSDRLFGVNIASQTGGTILGVRNAKEFKEYQEK